VSRVAGLLAIAVMGIFVLGTFNSSLDSRLAHLELPSQVEQTLDEQRVKMAGAEVPAGVSSEVRAEIEQAIAESFVTSFRVAMVTAAGLALASALTASVMIGGKRSATTAAPAVSAKR
jgi:hypothetical protein